MSKFELAGFHGKLMHPGVLTICNAEGDVLVRLDMDTGEHTFGENYEPTEAARIFWNAVSTFRRA